VKKNIDTVIVGAGQAGLAVSYHLSQRGREHLVLERARVAERWRTQRWDSLMFQFPNWSIELPGSVYVGSNPDGFSHKDEVLAFIEDYAVRIKAPVRTGVEVLSLRPASHPHCYLVSTNAGDFEARNVVIATGPYQRPRVPDIAKALPGDVLQVHASDYRNPGDLPPGGVLVVGSGASGCQISEELLVAGRQTFFAIGRHRRVPRRYRGRDVFWWRRALGHLDQKAEDTPIDRREPPPLVTGVGGGHDVDIRSYAKDGMTLLGHVGQINGGRLSIAGDLEHSLSAGDQTFNDFTSAVDEYVRSGGPDVVPATISPPPTTAQEIVTEIDIRSANIRSVVWATGYALDFRWVELPIFDRRGEPIQRRGVTSAPGIYFLGLAWMHKAKSSFLYGVGEDAEYLAERICEVPAQPLPSNLHRPAPAGLKG
jgi:putative flavoprotein involved in K+ transport